MASGRQKADENWATFQAWLTGKTDDDFRLIQSRGVLSRVEIAKECEFSKSALDQNPRIKNALRQKEDELRARGVIRVVVPQLDDSAIPQPGSEAKLTVRDTERLLRLEQENALLRAEKADLQGQVDKLTKQIERYSAMASTLAMTGRIPR